MAAKELGMLHQTATPHRPQTNAFAERGIWTMLEGTRASLLQAGLPPRFWPIAGRHHAFATAVAGGSDGEASPWMKLHGSDFDGWVLPFGCLIHYRPPKPVLKSLAKFSPTTIPGLFLGWHVEPGCAFRGDYLVVALEKFKTPSQTSFHAHRVKEIITFDATNFPLQAAMVESMIEVSAPKKDGEDIWAECTEQEESSELSKIDAQYVELFGEIPPDHFTFEQKYQKIAFELFGDIDADDDWDLRQNVGLALEDGSMSPPEPSQSEASGSSGDPQASTGTTAHDGDRRGHLVPRAKKITWPMRIRGTSAVAKSSWSSDTKACKDRAFDSMVAQSKTVPSPIARRKLTKISDRRLIEFCCSENSVLGQPKFVRTGCRVFRLTIVDDLTTEAGLQAALRAVTSAAPGEYIHLWASLPCTAGSPWQHLNKKYPSALDKIEKNMDIFLKLIVNFEKVAREVVEQGGDVSFEWPTGCALWKHELTQNLINGLSMNKVNMHGCAAGLTSSKDNVPIKKPWTVASTSPAIIDALNKFQCPGKELHPVHSPCSGAETKRTELYTPDMADAIHSAIREEALSQRATAAMASVPKVRGECDDAEDEMIGRLDPTGHREKLGPEGLWCTMITKTLQPSDPLARSPPAIKAIMDELTDLREHKVWDEANPVEASEVALKEPEAHIVRVFAIVGIKHFEDKDAQKYKGRIVVSGDKVKTATGQWAVFQEIGTVPSTMAACRILLVAFSLMKNAKLLQSDCVRAYVQAPMKGTKTYIRLPKAWWPKHWAARFRDPICELLQALYGHPHAGDFWYEKLEAELLRLNFTIVEGWPSVFILYPDGVATVSFVVYVDDLVMVGTEFLVDIIAEIRKNIKMEEPSDLQKYLGCVHHVTQKIVEGETITNVTFDMMNYFQAAIDQYLELATEKLNEVSTPFAPRLAPEELDALMAERGVFADHAASLVMKLMYGVRMAGPHLSTVVARLSSQITKWTRDSDRRLHRIYSYLAQAKKLTLKGSLSTGDVNEVMLIAWPDADLAGDFMTTKSTSGFFLEARGAEGRSFPISWGSKKQGCTAQHTAEAETISLATCLRSELLPAQFLLQKIIRRPVSAMVMEDNEATITSIRKGYSPAMRHLPRVHRISIGLLHEITTRDETADDGNVRVHKAATADHKGDLFTKELDRAKYEHALSMIQMN